MSLKDRIGTTQSKTQANRVIRHFGVSRNPFPASSQSTNNPHHPQKADEEAETKILSFMRDQRSQVVVVEGTQGVGKTNFLNFFEEEIQAALSATPGYYVVRYLSDPEASFDGTIRRLFQEFGTERLILLADEIASDFSLLNEARNPDLKSALRKLSEDDGNREELAKTMMEWLLGFRILKAHRELLGVQFRLDTVESKTSAFRDLVVVSSKAEILNGIFLLLDELEKQDGVLGPTAVVRYLSAMRAIIDALPNHLFMMIAVTPDAMRRYSSALPAFRSRLQNIIRLTPLQNFNQARKLARFYVDFERERVIESGAVNPGDEPLISQQEITDIFVNMSELAEKRGLDGVRQREFLHRLHEHAENMIQSL